MVEILIGNKRNNVVRKLKESRIARLLFILCCYYLLYSSCGRRAGLHIEEILYSLVMGIVLVNLMYIPIRLLGSSQIDHKIKFLFVVVADIVALVYFNVTEEISLTSILEKIFSGVVISLVATAIIISLFHNWRVHAQETRFLRKDFGNMDGWEFEKWSGMWLHQHGYENVQVTSGSGDYGADVLCSKQGVTYAVQCKLYNGKVPYRAVEEVVCAREYYHTDRAMIFTNSELTPQAKSAAEKLGVVVIDGGVL